MRKAVIPAAGFGTRFLPFTKAVPKEMIPLVDKPVIQYVVEEAVAAGLDEILIIISSGKDAIQNHFIPEFCLEQRLAAGGKTQLLAEMRQINRLANIQYIYQQELNGLGDAIRYAETFAGDEPFAVLLGDTVTSSDTLPVTAQLVNAAAKVNASVVAVEEIPWEKTNRYGIIDGDICADALYKVKHFVEKPDPGEAPSNLAVASRYIFTPEIFEFLKKTPAGKGGEIQITDAMRLMLESHNMYALKVDGRRHDIGNKLDFIKATVEFALKRPEFAESIRAWLNTIR
jgi:UTP--glucose-1-phosphate uridylyltransferase